MNITSDQKRIIESVISVFEGGKATGNYAAISTFDDAPNGSAQVSYGKHQATEFGALKPLLELYVAKKGQYAQNIEQYIDQIGKQTLASNDHFIELLSWCSRDDIMRQCQDEIFQERYFKRALKYADDNLFFKPLSLLVFYDSYIHGSPMANFLINRFSEVKPIHGGDEKTWVEKYVITRRAWLNGSIKLKPTVYRMDTMLKLISENNWDLIPPFFVNGVKII